MSVNAFFDSPFTQSREGHGAFLNRASGGGAAGPDAVARASAAKANANIDAITPQPLEIIPDGGVVVTPQGLYENKTGGPRTLDATDPQTGTSVTSQGLTPFTSGSTDTGTNYTVPITAFVDPEKPTTIEARTWYEAIAAASRTTDDVILYQSAGGVLATYMVGDGDGGSEAFSQAFYSEPQAPSLAIKHISAVETLSVGTKYYITTSGALAIAGQTTDVDGQPLDYVDFPVADGVAVDDELKIVVKGSPFKGVHLPGTFQGSDTPIINAKDELVTLTWTATGYVWSKG
ncbi:hypothetical protein [uncultured Paraglaciecola sp.]|uniref:hypothetical protein n=1 Tax=uncultured Paraglaciecola sp. TaxID=1765024 RepID=UPI00262C05E2|nr:hypothetical protein [uncultured Paraglaciecola sp.]